MSCLLRHMYTIFLLIYPELTILFSQPTGLPIQWMAEVFLQIHPKLNQEMGTKGMDPSVKLYQHQDLSLD